MAQPLRIERPSRVSHLSSRTIDRRYWFIHNQDLANQMLGYIGKLQARHAVKLSAVSLMDNHFHFLSQFPEVNRVHFVRDFKSQFQRELKRSKVAKFPGGPLWSRRYDEQELPLHSDIEDYFWYVVLQQVRAGMCDRIEDSPTYNCFLRAISGEHQIVEFFNRTAFSKALKQKSDVRREDFIEKYELRLERLPGYETLSQAEYQQMMMRKYPEKLREAIRDREQKGILRSLTAHERAQIHPGDLPTSEPVEDEYERRPIVLSACANAFRESMEEYESIKLEHSRASRSFRLGDLLVQFPIGTFRPPCMVWG